MRASKESMLLACSMDCFAALAMTLAPQDDDYSKDKSPWLPSTRTSSSTLPLPTSGTRCAISARCIQRLVPGFVLDIALDGDARIVTFANGTVARELLVDCDEARRRLVYAVVSERVKQHSASVQVIADGDGRSRLIWIVDVLPHEIAPYMNAQMDQAALAMQKKLGRSAA